MENILGIVLIVVPLLGFFLFTVYDLGWKNALKYWGLVICALIAAIVLAIGFYILTL